MNAVAVIDTGVANIASIRSAFRTLGVGTETAREPTAVLEADRIVLPGVGDFATGISRIRGLKIDSALKDALERGTPILAICLGMQLLCDGSEESPGVPGLGIIPGTCRRLPESVRVPHLGWNIIEPDSDSVLLRPGFAAFANSYALTGTPPGWSAARTNYGGRVISALEMGGALGCQFPPQMSGGDRLDLSERSL